MCVAAVRGEVDLNGCWGALDDIVAWLGFEGAFTYTRETDEQGPFVLLRIPESERNRLAQKFAAPSKEKTP